MDLLDLLEMIKQGEDSRLQFKVKMDSIDQLAAEICAFSNSKGGTILNVC
jgi:ATP-dependent DNA helicase RecG